MMKPWLNRTVILALALAVVVTAGTSVAKGQQPGDGQQNAAAAPGERSDGQIEMDVVKALDDSQALKNDLITAATIQSEVTLSGTVSSDASKQLAESIVSKIPGVTKVNNHLKVGNPADDQNAQVAPPEPAPRRRQSAPTAPESSPVRRPGQSAAVTAPVWPKCASAGLWPATALWPAAWQRPAAA